MQDSLQIYKKWKLIKALEGEKSPMVLHRILGGEIIC